MLSRLAKLVQFVNEDAREQTDKAKENVESHDGITRRVLTFWRATSQREFLGAWAQVVPTRPARIPAQSFPASAVRGFA